MVLKERGGVIIKLINFVYNHNTKWYLISATALMFVGVVLIFTQYFGAITLADDKALDMLFNYDKTTFYAILHLLDDSDRLAYKLIHISDYVFIIGVYPLISMSLSRFIEKTKKLRVLIVLPLIAGLFDILENIMMDSHLYAYPNEIMFMGSLSGIFTTIKFLCLYASVVLLLFFGLFKLIRRNYGK
ncbi:hypothetical protein RJI07_06000 [Mycoplasmatota bacterium WC30]